MRLPSFLPTAAAFAGFLGLAAGAPAAGPAPIQERLEKAVRAFPGTLGIAARNLDTGESFAVNGDARFPTASLIKVAVMVEAYHQIAKGKFRAETAVTLAESDKAGDEPVVPNQLHPGISLTVSDLLALMIAFSDNTAMNLLVRRVGAANVDRRMLAYGLPNTKIFRPTFRDGHADVFPEEEKEFGLGMTTPNEIARLRHHHLRPSNQGQEPHRGQPGPHHGSGDVPNGLRQLQHGPLATISVSTPPDSLSERVVDAETGETDEAAVVRPDFDRSIVECRQADLKIEDSRTVDAQLPSQPQEPVPEAFARRPKLSTGLGD